MKQLKLRPLAGFVLIEPIDDQETTATGLVMPEKAKEKPGKGKVVEVGEGILHYEGHEIKDMSGYHLPLEKCSVKRGDIVIFHRWAGQDVKEGQKEYRLVKFADLMGVYV